MYNVAVKGFECLQDNSSLLNFCVIYIVSAIIFWRDLGTQQQSPKRQKTQAIRPVVNTLTASKMSLKLNCGSKLQEATG